MLKRTAHALATLIVALSALHAQEDTAAYKGITWETDYDAAFKKAKAQNKPVMFGIMMDKERGCTTMLRDVYTDPRIIAKSREFINLPCCRDDMPQKKFLIGSRTVPSNPFFPGVTTRQCITIESKMRLHYQKSDTVIAPQHIWVKPDGKVLIKREYWLTVEQMLDLMDRALRQHKGLKGEAVEKRPAPHPGTHESAKGEGEATEEEHATEPSAEEKRLIALLVSGPLEEKEEAARKLLSGGNPLRAKAFVDAIVNRRIRSRKDQAAVIRAVGAPSFASGAEEMTRLLEHKDKLLRNCTVVTFEEMAASEVATALMKRFKAEKDKLVKKDILQALGPCGRGNEKARKFLLEQLATKNAMWRASAIMGLAAHLSGDDVVRKALGKRWKKETSRGNGRIAILWAYLQTGDASLARDLTSWAEKERNGQTRQLLKGVAALLEGRQPEMGGGRGRRGGGPGGAWRIYQAFAPLYAKDRVERRVIKEMRERFARRRPGR